jgi:hypothetical protein
MILATFPNRKSSDAGWILSLGIGVMAWICWLLIAFSINCDGKIDIKYNTI